MTFKIWSTDPCVLWNNKNNSIRPFWFGIYKGLLIRYLKMQTSFLHSKISKHFPDIFTYRYMLTSGHFNILKAWHQRIWLRHLDILTFFILTSWHPDIFTSGHLGIMTCLHQDILTSWHFYIRTYLHPDIFTSGHIYILTFLHQDILTLWHVYTRTSWHPDIITSGHLDINWHPDIFISGHLDILTFLHPDILP